jgi:hypothetical protein
LYHDFGIYGYDALGIFSDLEERYHVNLKNFNIDKYFPPKFGSKRVNYQPFTIGMLDKMIHTKRCRPKMLFEGIDPASFTKDWLNSKIENNKLLIIIILCLFLIYIIIKVIFRDNAIPCNE